MSPYYEIHDEAYYYDGQLYCSTFPLEWIESSIEGTGPLDCVLCDTHGSLNGVFLGYCVYCADEYHDAGENRGNGLAEEGSVEMNLENYDYYLQNNVHTSFIMENLHTYRGKGAMDTYLRDIDRSRFTKEKKTLSQNEEEEENEEEENEDQEYLRYIVANDL